MLPPALRRQALLLLQVLAPRGSFWLFSYMLCWFLFLSFIWVFLSCLFRFRYFVYM